MKKNRLLKIFLIILSVIVSGIYFFVQYSNRQFLTYGVLHIKEKPASLKIIRCESFGITDSRMEYYVSIDDNDIIKLLQGRKYSLTSKPMEYFKSWSTAHEKSDFQAKFCYTAGNLSNGLVNIFLNKSKSEAYIVYDVD